MKDIVERGRMLFGSMLGDKCRWDVSYQMKTGLFKAVYGLH